MQKISEFIEGLLKEKGIFIDDPEIRKETVADMAEKLEDQINRACVEALPEEKAAELAKIITAPDFNEEKMTEFMQNSGVDMEKIATETMQKFRELYLNGEEKNA